MGRELLERHARQGRRQDDEDGADPVAEQLHQQPYAAIPDKNQNVWAPLWTTDQIAKYDSKAGTWTMFDLPTRGTEIRITSLLERGNDLKLVFAYARTSKVAVMAVRSEAEMAALKAQVATNNRATQ